MLGEGLGVPRGMNWSSHAAFRPITSEAVRRFNERRFRPGKRLVVRALLAMLIGMLAGGAFNAALGEQGADTPAFVLIGGVLGLGGVTVAQGRRRRRETQDD